MSNDPIPNPEVLQRLRELNFGQNLKVRSSHRSPLQIVRAMLAREIRKKETRYRVIIKPGMTAELTRAGMDESIAAIVARKTTIR